MARSVGYAAAALGFALVLLVPAFLLGGGGHGTALFGLIVLAPGSVGGDDEWAASGLLFWPLLGFLIGQAERRGRRVAIVLMMAAHYAVALLHLSRPGLDGADGAVRAWAVVPILVALFCLAYAIANVAIWVLAFRKRAAHT
jgi:hypothetical protein